MIMSAQTHLINQFDEDLDELKHLLYSMGDRSGNRANQQRHQSLSHGRH